MTRIGRLLTALALTACVLGAALAWLLLFYKAPPVDPAWALDGSREIPAGAVTVRFTGTSTLLFSDGETSWMVDGWFSRPGPLSLLFGKIAPDPEFRERALGDPLIDQPLVPPVAAFDYRLGVPYVLHVSHPRGSWLVVGSAGYEEGALEGLQADTVFLGVGGLGSQTADYRQAFWRETVGRVAPSRVIPIHYDSLTAPAEGPFRGPSNAEAFLAGGLENTRLFLEQMAADNPSLRFNTLPRFDEVVLYD